MSDQFRPHVFRIQLSAIVFVLGSVEVFAQAESAARPESVGQMESGAPMDARVPTESPGQSKPPRGCIDCHKGVPARGDGVAPPELLSDSVHAGVDCTDCHESVSLDDLDAQSPAPHGDSVEPVACGTCHEDQEEIYVVHGRLTVGESPDVPRCASCHGTHDIRSPEDRRSRVHRFNVADTCCACHTDPELVKRHRGLRDAPLKMYKGSVHGRAKGKGVYTAATCVDCHSAAAPDGSKTSHRILSAANVESTIYHFAIPDTCGKCHEAIAQDYWEGIHGQAVKRGSVDAPVCTHCHGVHDIISPDDPNSPVSSKRLTESTCAPCHESVALTEKYGLAGGRLATYIDSYHGLKSKTGDAKVANCASCHGTHRILPSTDASSSIHPNNLRATCGECHPGISSELAQMKIHETSTGMRAGWPDFFRRCYIGVIVIVVGGMLLHNGADWLRRVRRLNTMPRVQRLSVNEVFQHWVLMISFIVLVVTGFSLRFSEAGWVKFLFGWKGGFELRGVVHRVAAVGLLVAVIMHLFYLLGRRGRQWLRDMIPRRSDVRDLLGNLRFFVGGEPGPPRFGRFSYMEKLEYWSMIWGTAIMMATGLVLCFDDYFVSEQNLPKVLLEVGLVVHYYEAWLAFLAILVWHIYGTVFSPAAYPMNTAWLAGKMSKEMYAHEHPEGPKLKGRTWTCHYEEEERDDDDEASRREPEPASVR